jgi:predicted component of type VI protein secretion system
MDGKSDAEELIRKALKDPSLLQALSSGGGAEGGQSEGGA